MHFYIVYCFGLIYRLEGKISDNIWALKYSQKSGKIKFSFNYAEEFDLTN